MKRLIKKNTTAAYVPDKSGIYKIYDKRKKLIYVGISKNGKHSGLKHRLQSYTQKDDFKEHRTKKALRSDARYFKYKTMRISKARRIENRLKKNLKHNHK